MDCSAFLEGRVSWLRYVELTGHSPNCIGERGLGFDTCDCGGPHYLAFPSGPSLCFDVAQGWQRIDGAPSPYCRPPPPSNVIPLRPRTAQTDRS